MDSASQHPMWCNGYLFVAPCHQISFQSVLPYFCQLLNFILSTLWWESREKWRCDINWWVWKEYRNGIMTITGNVSCVRNTEHLSHKWSTFYFSLDTGNWKQRGLYHWAYLQPHPPFFLRQGVKLLRDLLSFWGWCGTCVSFLTCHWMLFCFY